jgi:outer membrane beta-barrel protein
MKRSAICLFLTCALGGWGSVAFAQAGKADKAAEKAAGEAAAADDKAGAAAPVGDDSGIEGLDTSTTPDKKADEAALKTQAQVSWSDILAVQRKPFLKSGRLEVAPFSGLSVNDILIRHYMFGLDLNYFVSDALSVGLQGTYYVKALTERETLLGLQYHRIPTLNRNVFGAALNLGYSLIYGKFALFNRSIVSWEMLISGGVGITRTEIIPRIPGDELFTTNAITPHVAIGGRFFLLDWLTINFSVRDYILLDKFEPTDRMPGESIDAVKNRADSQIINNIMFYAGVGFFVPPKFTYKLPR